MSIKFEVNPYTQAIQIGGAAPYQVNHKAYVKIPPETTSKTPEGSRRRRVYVCYNRGSCIHLNLHLYRWLWGIDCNTPLCRHIQTDKYVSNGEVVGYLNRICKGKDDCGCITTESILHTVDSDVWPPFSSISA